MKIIRNALVELSDSRDEEIDSWVSISGNSETFVGYHQSFEDDVLHVLITSVVALDDVLHVNQKNEIIFPLNSIDIAEENIEREACLLSVQTKSSKEIFSPIPYFLIVYETREELAWLNSTSGYRIGGAPTMTFDFSVHECQSISSDFLNDRWDGVVLFSEALSHKNSMGKYRDYMRFFELAFCRKITQLDRKLYQLLQGFPALNYTKQEIKE